MARFGEGHYIGFGELGFATDGTSTDIKVWFRGADGTDQLQFDREIVEVRDFSNWDDDVNILFPGIRTVTGSVTIQPTFGYLAYILRHVTGHNDTPSAGPPYLYEFLPVDFSSGSHHIFGSTPRGFCIESFKGAAESTYYHGCVVTSWELRLEAGAAAELTLNFIGRKYSNDTKSTPTFKNDLMVCPTGQANNVLSLASTPRITRSLTLSVDHKLEPRRDISDIETLLPYPNGKREVMVTAEIETDDDTDLDRVDDPKASRYSTNTIRLEQQGVSTRYLLIELPDLVVRGPAETRVAGLGVLTTSLTLKAFGNGSTPSYAIDLANDDSAYPV